VTDGLTDGLVEFADVYLEELTDLRPDRVLRSPCLGYGRGGIAYALLRAGTLREDRSLLLAARDWAHAGLRTARRFRLRGWPKASYSRGLSGLHATCALIARALDDDATCAAEIERFLAASRSARGSLDLFQGAAGRLAGAAILRRLSPSDELRAHGDTVAARLASALARRTGDLSSRGLAHGWEGVAFGILAWGAPSSDAVRRALHAFRPDAPAADWAHGLAGLAMLHARAYEVLGDPQLLAWARAAGERAHATAPQGWSMLNGTAGIAYALLAVARVDPAGPWRERARDLAARAIANVDVPARNPYGLWSGLSGLFCLALDLAHETTAGFPGLDA
jgi:hypothetical protein